VHETRNVKLSEYSYDTSDANVDSIHYYGTTKSVKKSNIETSYFLKDV